MGYDMDLSETYVLQFPNAKGGIRQDDLGYWHWWTSHSDGSGSEGNWCPTKRGAMICCINMARHKSHNYGQVKYKWVKESA